MEQSIDKSRRALEEEFFARHNQDLMRRLKDEQEKLACNQELSILTGIKDRNILDRLVGAEIMPSTIAALSLVPLILIAWADGVIDPVERLAILNALEQQGIEPNHPSYSLVFAWLHTKPSPNLLATWETYVKGLGQVMDQSSFAQLKIDILNRTEGVAQAAGGFLGIGSKISSSERELYKKVEAAFAI